MPTLDELRSAFPHLPVSDDMLQSPAFHIGVIQSYLPQLPDRVQLSLDIIWEAIKQARQDELAADLVMKRHMRLRGVPVIVHGWFHVQFKYAGWTECECGFRPESQEEMDAHIPPTEET